MKQATKTTMTTIAAIVLMITVVYLIRRPLPGVPVPVPIHVPYPVVQRETEEFHRPPIKEYKPAHVQQMGLLLGEDGETLPLYGKEVRGRRDRYHYYTSTPGEQIYSLPVTHDNRDCMDDMGCQELYGNESIQVMGKASPYQAKLYRTENFFNIHVV